jgi:hypothetical protein
MATGTTLMGRKQAENLMESTCVITRKTGTTVDHDTSLDVDTFDTIYTGKCRLRFPFIRPQQALAVDQQLVKDRGILSLPVVGSNTVQADDIATVTLSPVLDPDTVITGRIEAPMGQTFATARRFPFEVTN